MPIRFNPLQPSNGSRSSSRRFFFLILLMAATVLLLWASNIEQYFSSERISSTIESIRTFESQFGLAGPVIFWLLGSAAIIISFPTVIIIWFAVLSYGPFFGAVLSILCLNSAGLSIFFISSFLGRDYFSKRFGSRLDKIEAKFEQRGLITVVYLRLLFFMLPPLTWILGLMNLKFRDFFLGTLLGTLQHVILYAWIADLGVKIIQEGRSLLFWKSPELIPPVLVGLCVFSAVRIWDRRRQGKMKNKSGNQVGMSDI